MNAEERAQRNAAIVDAYQRGDRLADISAVHGISESAIVHLVRRNGVPRRNTWSGGASPFADRDARIAEEYQAGRPLAEIASDHHMTVSRISAIARRAGVTGRYEYHPRGPQRSWSEDDDAYLMQYWDAPNGVLATHFGVAPQYIDTRRRHLRILHDLPYRIAHLTPEERQQRDTAIVEALRAGMAYAEIVEAHQVAFSQVTRIAKEHGISRYGPRDTRGNHTPSERAAVYAGILADRASGMTYAEIATRRKVSQATISRVVNTHGLTQPAPSPLCQTASTSPHADAISWALIQQDTWSTADLDAMATRYNVDRDSLYDRAKYLRKHGWSCPLSRKPCAVCGKPLLTKKQTGYQAMHPACKRQRDNERLAGKGAEWAAEAQQRTVATAHAAKRPWSEDDDTYLIAHQTEAAEQLAIDLGRSIYAINTRIHRLAEQGKIDTHARRSARAKARGFGGRS